MARERWIEIGSLATALGGVSWLAKVAVIVATDGEVIDEGAAAVFYILGLALLAVGSTSVGVLMSRSQSRLVLGLATAISPLVFLFSFAVLDGIAKPLLGNRGPAYLKDEAGIICAALLWLALSIGILLATRRMVDVQQALPVRTSPESDRVWTS